MPPLKQLEAASTSGLILKEFKSYVDLIKLFNRVMDARKMA